MNTYCVFIENDKISGPLKITQIPESPSEAPHVVAMTFKNVTSIIMAMRRLHFFRKQNKENENTIAK